MIDSRIDVTVAGQGANRAMAGERTISREGRGRDGRQLKAVKAVAIQDYGRPRCKRGGTMDVGQREKQTDRQTEDRGKRAAGPAEA